MSMDNYVPGREWAEAADGKIAGFCKDREIFEVGTQEKASIVMSCSVYNSDYQVNW